MYMYMNKSATHVKKPKQVYRNTIYICINIRKGYIFLYGTAPIVSISRNKCASINQYISICIYI